MYLYIYIYIYIYIDIKVFRSTPVGRYLCRRGGISNDGAPLPAPHPPEASLLPTPACFGFMFYRVTSLIRKRPPLRTIVGP